MARPEHPRPQMEREKWLNLNGEWEFEIDHGNSGRVRGFVDKPLKERINVPFCPESRLSGIGYVDFMDAVWYRHTFKVPAVWGKGKIMLHFGAVYYLAEVWVDGASVGVHKGGHSSFSFDITSALNDGNEHIIVVCAQSDVRSNKQPSGKQSASFESYGCVYTRTTGIWQTVWLEWVPDAFIKSIKLYPDIDNSRVHVHCKLAGNNGKNTVTAKAFFQGNAMGQATAQASGDTCILAVDLQETHLWEVGKGNLYDLDLAFGDDSVHSYFGLRSVSLVGKAIHINNKPVFQRLVLDQGFYPDGVITAPVDDDFRMDIQRAIDCGFNGARLHQKVFEERFLYWADRTGYLVWGEWPNWGLDISSADALGAFLPEWTEVMERDFNHPSIVGWCPFNETQRDRDHDVLRQAYRVTKAIDSTRPVIDTSGWHHVETDIYDIHDYDQDYDVFTKKYGPGVEFGQFHEHFDTQKHEGQPFFVSEYGGIWWDPSNSGGWGYGVRPESEVAFLERFEGLTRALLNNPNICALCYTQLTDVEQEVNGLYTYTRDPKFDVRILRSIMSKKAAIEQG